MNRQAAPTPNVSTVVDFAVSTQVVLKRPAQNIYRTGAEIARGVTIHQLPSSDPAAAAWSGNGVSQMPDGSWTLTSYQRLIASNIFTVGASEMVFSQGSNAQVTPQVGTGLILQRAPTDLPNAEVGSGIAAEAASGFRKKVAAGDDWNEKLAADEAAYAIPLDPDSVNNPDVGIHRVIAGYQTFGENCGFTLNFGVPRSWYGNYSNFINFYFGGATPVYPAPERGGEFVLKLYGHGVARLFEYTREHTWQKRFSFRWAEEHAPSGKVYSVGIEPYAWDRMALFTKTKETSDGNEQLSVPWGREVNIKGNLYRDVFAMSEHYHLRAMTGPGVCRLDVANTYRYPVSANKNKHVLEGYLTDGVVCFDHDMDADTHLQVTPYAYIPEECSVTVIVYDAKTHAALSQDILTGDWLTNADSRAYYVRFHLTTSDQYKTPVLIGYNLGVNGETHTVFATPISSQILERISITGPDVKADHETASASIQDVTDDLSSTVGNRGRIHSKIKIVEKDTRDIIGYIFEGETAKSPSKLKGKPWIKEWPSDQWKEYDTTFVGMWARLEDQFHAGRAQSFQKDPYGATDIRGNPLPWKITDIIKWLLNNAGWPANQINVPDYSTRLFPSPELGVNDYMILPSARYSDLIQRFALDFLGQYVFWDPNSNNGGEDGMWRMITTPPTYTNVLANFVSRRPEILVPTLSTHSGSYGPNTFFIEEGTMQNWIEPPEFNYISVSTVGQLLPGDNGSKMRYTNFLQNKASLDTPSSPDYLEGRWVPVYIVDPFIGGGQPWEIQNAVDKVVRRTYDLGAHARQWVVFRAQLLMVADNIDPLRVYRRPLRLADVITIDGDIYLVRSCNPDYESDQFQAANYEALKV